MVSCSLDLIFIYNFNLDPDYSAVYVTLVTDVESCKGFGIGFTLGRGNEIVVHCVDSLRFLVIGKSIQVCN